MALFESYIEHNLQNLYKMITKYSQYIDNITKNIKDNPYESIPKLLITNFFKVMTHCIIETKCPIFALKIVKLISDIFNLISDCEMYNFLTKKESNGKFCLKLISELYNSHIFEYIAKLVCNSKENLNDIRILMASITLSLESSSKYMSELERSVYIMSLGKLMLAPLHTRHMIMCLTKMDILNLKASYNIKLIPLHSNKKIIKISLPDNSEYCFESISTKDDIELHIIPHKNYNPVSKKYILDWTSYDNTKKDIITLSGISLIPNLLKEIENLNREIPKEASLKHLAKLSVDIVEVLQYKIPELLH